MPQGQSPYSLGLTDADAEFDTGAGRCEVRIGLGVPGFAIVLPASAFQNTSFRR
jgi:hypothetical protein